MRARAILSSYLPRSLALSRFPTKSFISPAYKNFIRNSFVSPTYAKTGGCTPLKMSARRHLLSLFSQSPLLDLFPFNYLRTLSFSVLHVSPIPPAPSALFAEKLAGTPHSGHTNASALSFVKKPLLCVPSQRTLRLCGESLPSPAIHHSLPWTHKRHRRRRPQRAPAMLQLARGGSEHRGKQRLRLVEGEGEAEEIGAAGVGVFFVAGGSRGEGC